MRSLVRRPGGLPVAQRAKAPVVPFTRPARYHDGVTVTVTRIAHDTVTDTGAGAPTGQARTTFTLRVGNASPVPVDLSQVVVVARYGAGSTLAAPVYEGTVADFSGAARPGGSRSARYAFAVPKAQLGRVVLVADFDGRHLAAVFSGSAR